LAVLFNQEYRAQLRSAIAISEPLVNRSAGRLARAFANTLSILGGMPALLVDIGAGSSVVILVINTAMLVALNGTSPTKSS
jgi:hypothetical protein